MISSKSKLFSVFFRRELLKMTQTNNKEKKLLKIEVNKKFRFVAFYTDILKSVLSAIDMMYC